MKGIPILCIVIVSSTAVAAPLSCPRHARVPHGTIEKPLTSVRVLSYAATEPPPNNEALPTHAPDAEIHDKHVVRQTWRVNADAPDYTYELHCIYGDSDRLLRFAIPTSAEICTATDDLRTSKFTMTCR